MNKNRAAPRFLILLIAVTLTVSCAPGAPADTDRESAEADRAATVSLRSLDNPAAADSGEPNLAAGRDGRVLMSWAEPHDDGQAVVTSTLDPASDSWSEPTLIVAASDLFVNWADFPSVIQLTDGSLAAHWLQRLGSGTYAYGVKVATSGADGTWQGGWAHDDESPTEHGFVSLVAEADGGFTAVWLDGRAYAEGSGAAPEMSLRSRRFGANGEPGAEELLDPRTCDCCQTGAGYIGTALVAAYRDRSDSEVRDIQIVRRTSDGWTEPYTLGADNWQISGCPVNGPVVVSTGGTSGAVAWFSMVNEAPEVKVALTVDEGASFGEPILIERGGGEQATLGRVGAAPLGDGSTLVVWLTQVGKVAEVRYRIVDMDGEPGPVGVIANTGPARSSGFPRVVTQGTSAYVAWTDTLGDAPVVRTAVLEGIIPGSP